MTVSLKLALANPADVGRTLVQLISRAELVDGQPPFNDQALVDASTGARETVTATVGNAIAAAAIFGRGELELVVDPEYRRNGLGAALLDRVLDGVPADVAAWAHGDHPASSILAARSGFEPIRRLLQLRMPLASAETAQTAAHTPASDGIEIRAFQPDRDAEAWVSLNAEVFAAHPEQGKMTLADLAARRAESWFDAGDFLVATSEDSLIGYNWLKIEPDGHEPGEIYVIGVSESASGRGLGRRLMTAGLARLRERGATAAALYVESDNEGAVHLYRSLGFTDHTVDVQYRRPTPA
jgi:mycothiol synthase